MKPTRKYRKCKTILQPRYSCKDGYESSNRYSTCYEKKRRWYSECECYTT